MTLVIRVRSKSDATEFRRVVVDGPGLFSCDCGGFSGLICSHVDAVLIAGERHMVPDEDHLLADEGMALIGTVEVPENWQGSWRRNLKWRGLSRRAPSPRVIGLSGKPVVCFTGNMAPRGRSELIAEAEANGWEAVDSAHSRTTVLVAADALGQSRKLVEARRRGIPIVSTEDWPTVMIDGVFPD